MSQCPGQDLIWQSGAHLLLPSSANLTHLPSQSILGTQAVQTGTTVRWNLFRNRDGTGTATLEANFANERQAGLACWRSSGWWRQCCSWCRAAFRPCLPVGGLVRKCFHRKRSQHLLWLAPEFLPPIFPASWQQTNIEAFHSRCKWRHRGRWLPSPAPSVSLCQQLSTASRSFWRCCCRDGRLFSVVHSPHDSKKRCCCWRARSCAAQIELRCSTPVVDFFFFFLVPAESYARGWRETEK